MKLTKNITKTYDIKYVDCNFELEDPSRCRLNGVSSAAQTVKHLPFLKYNIKGFQWSPRIILENGRVVCWPKGLTANINFNLKSFVLSYLTNVYECAFKEERKLPDFLQLDLIDNSETLNFTINPEGYIENWPSSEEILKQLL
jgi:hypothetical protein